MEALGLPPEAPIWLLAALMILNMFKEPISNAFFKTFPAMADSHFASKSKDRDDRREFEQRKEMETLKAQLAESESQRQRQAERERAAIEREGEYIGMLKSVITTNHSLLMQKMDTISPPIVTELENLRRAIDRLASRYDGKMGSTQNKILEHIQGR